MASGKRKRSFSTYILPILFCGLLIALAVLKNRSSEQPVKAVLQEAEPLSLTEQAIENYLYSAGFTWTGEGILDAEGKKRATLTVTRGESGSIEAMTLVFPLPTYYETGSSNEALSSVKANHDAAVQRGEDLFLSLLDAISATDSRVAARRDSALDKLEKTLDTGKSSAQAANGWRFSFSFDPGEIEGTATILFTLVK